MMGRFLDDGDLRHLPQRMLIKKKPPAPSVRRRTAAKRKVDPPQADLQRQLGHHVALAADKLRVKNSETVGGFAGTLSVAPLTYSIRRDDSDFVAFRSAKPEDAEAFAGCLSGKRLPERRADPGNDLEATHPAVLSG
jgi:hypothetical protein